MNKRYIGAVILAPLLIFLFLGGIYLKILVFLLSLLGIYELYKVVEEKDIHPIKVLGYIFCAIYFWNLSTEFEPSLIFYTLIGLTAISLCIPVINTKFNFIDIAITLLGLLYVPIFFGFITLINVKPHGEFLVWLIFISSWVSDTCAYYAGRFFGKKKLCPKVSPKKTIEGSIGGLIGSMLGCAIFGAIIKEYGVNIPIYHYLTLGILGGIFGQFGDLVASSIKRYAGVKDYSNLIPGHGGILDRFDSILFVSVVVYYYITFIMGM